MLFIGLLQQSYFSKLRWSHICRSCYNNKVRNRVCNFCIQCCLNLHSTNLVLRHPTFIHVGCRSATLSLAMENAAMRRFSFHQVFFIFPYIDPSLPRTVFTVLNKILTSSAGVHSFIYFVSSLTTSSKSVISLLPLTCHIPVIPGLIASLAR